MKDRERERKGERENTKIPGHGEEIPEDLPCKDNPHPILSPPLILFFVKKREEEEERKERKKNKKTRERKKKIEKR